MAPRNLMMMMMGHFFSSLVLAGTIGCVTVHRESPALPSPAVVPEQITQTPPNFFHHLEDLAQTEPYEVFVQEWDRQFSKTENQIYLYEGLLLKAETLGRWGNFAEEKALLLDLRERSENRYPSLYERSNLALVAANEGLQEDDEGIALLLQLVKTKPQTASLFYDVEAPAKLSMLYQKLGQTELALKYQRKATNKLAEWIDQGRIDKKNLLPRLYFQMGAVILQSVDKDNFQAQVRTLENSQFYLLKSIELEEPYWSRRARQQLVENYRVLVQFIQTEQKKPFDTFTREEMISRVKMMLNLLSQTNTFSQLRSEQNLHQLTQFFEAKNENEKMLLLIFDQLLKLPQAE